SRSHPSTCPSRRIPHRRVRILSTMTDVEARNPETTSDSAAVGTDDLPVDPALVTAAERLDADQAMARHEELAQAIPRATRLYYQDDAPELTDAEYDALFRELVALESAKPELVTADSPTQRVGGAISTTFDEVRHGRPVLSLSDAFSHDEHRGIDAAATRA